HEVLRRMLLAVTYGAAPSIAVAQPARLQGEVYRCLDEVNRRKPWLTRKRPEPWAALVMSDNTRNFYGRSAGRVEERYLANVLGVDYRGLPTTAAGKGDLDANFARGVGPDYWERRKGVFDFQIESSSFLNRGRMRTYVGGDPVTFKGPAVRVAPRAGAGVPGT